MIDFILKNWYYLILAFIAVATFIVSLISMIKKSKNKGNIIEMAKESCLENLPFWITISEGISGGEQKLENVLSLGIALVRKMLGRNLSADENDYFVGFIKESVEKILATPQKKLQAPKNSPSGKYRAN